MAELFTVVLEQVSAPFISAFICGRISHGSIDKVLLFGVILSATLPLDLLLPEMHRLLKLEGALAVWIACPQVVTCVPDQWRTVRLYRKRERSEQICVHKLMPTIIVNRKKDLEYR